MTKNMGSADRVVRTIVALAVGYLIFSGAIAGTLAIVLGVFAIVFLLTSMVSFCPLYRPLGLSTCSRQS